MFTTFKEAALPFDFVSTDNEIFKIMSEAASCLMPNELRKFFVFILIGCSETDGLSLWNNFKNQLSEEISENKALIEIIFMLEKENLDNARFVLPNICNTIMHPKSSDTKITSWHGNIYKNMYVRLNNMQKHIFNKIIASIESNFENNCFYVDGPAGCVKTFLYETIIHYVVSKNLNVLTLAWTGMAAILLYFWQNSAQIIQTAA